MLINWTAFPEGPLLYFSRCPLRYMDWCLTTLSNIHLSAIDVQQKVAIFSLLDALKEDEGFRIETHRSRAEKYYFIQEVD